jgi:hypothetical protein
MCDLSAHVQELWREDTNLGRQETVYRYCAGDEIDFVIPVGPQLRSRPVHDPVSTFGQREQRHTCGEIDCDIDCDKVTSSDVEGYRQGHSECNDHKGGRTKRSITFNDLAVASNAYERLQ